MPEIPKQTIAIFYHEQPDFDANPRPVDFAEVHQLFALCTGESGGQAFNVFETIKMLYVPAGQTTTDLTIENLANWCHKFQQALWRACLELTELRTQSENLREKVIDDPSFSSFARSLGEAIEMGRLVLSAGARTGIDVSAIESFLANPIAVETVHIQAIDVSKKLLERYRATVGTQRNSASNRTSAKESRVSEHHPQNHSDTKSGHQPADQNGRSLYIIAGAVGGFVVESIYVLATWSEHSTAFWEMYIAMPCWVLSLSFLIYALIVNGHFCVNTVAFYISVGAGILLASGITCAYLSKGADAMPFLPISTKARFIPALILTLFALLAWAWSIWLTNIPPTPTTVGHGDNEPTTPAATIPTNKPLTPPTATRPSRPTTQTAPTTTRSPIAILRRVPPPIDWLIYAEFGEGDMDSADRWLITCNDGETLISRVQTLFRQADPSRVTLSGLHLPDKFLDGIRKQLKLYFSDGTKIILDEHDDYVSTDAMRQNLKRKIDREEQGLRFRARVHVGNWLPGVTFTEYEFAKTLYPFQRSGIIDDSYIDAMEPHLAAGRIEMVP